jgi:hypothetical protein
MRSPLYIVLIATLCAVVGWAVWNNRGGRRTTHGSMANRVASQLAGPAGAPLAEVELDTFAQRDAGPSNEMLGEQVLQAAHFNDPDRLRQLIAEVVRDFGGAEKAWFLAQLGRAMASLSTVEMIDLIHSADALRDRQALANAALDQLFIVDAHRATGFASLLKDPMLRASAFHALGTKWAAHDIEAASAWALGLTDPFGRKNGVEGVASKWMQSDPQGAYAWATTLDDPALRGQVFLKMAKVLALQDPKQAVDWALQFPAGTSRDQALQFSVARWAEKDLEAAVDWTLRLADPTTKAPLEVAIARSWSNLEPQGATMWAAEIRDPQARTTALQIGLRKWAEYDTAAAVGWLSNQSHVGGEKIFANVTHTLVQSQLSTAEEWVAGTTNPAWRATGERILAQQRARLTAK